MSQKSNKKSKKKETPIWPQFIAYWCSEGLESIIDVHTLEKEQFFNVLRSKDPTKDLGSFDQKIYKIISSMILRARYNQHRHYEIYAFNAQDGITKEDVEEAFNSSPQTMADTIRRIGVRIHSDRRSTTNEVIK